MKTLRAGSCARFTVLLAAMALMPVVAHGQTARDTTSSRPAARDTTRARGTVPADSLPSEDARAVLRGIPEPLAPEEQVEPADSLLRESEQAAAPDSASAADSSGVPIPAETAPLGERPGARRAAAPDSASASGSPPAAAPGSAPHSAAPGSAAPAGATPPSAMPGSGGSSGGSPAVPDTCWRVQLAAPTSGEEAAARRAAAESQLLVPMAIEVEQGRHKVRSRDCLARAAADALKARALLSGFADAFLIRMSTDGKAISASPPKPASVRRTASKPASTRRGTSGPRR